MLNLPFDESEMFQTACWRNKACNKYKNSAKNLLRRESWMQPLLFEHFQSPGHTGLLGDVCIILIDKTGPINPTNCKNYWRQTVKTLALYSLNIEESIVFRIIFAAFVQI